LNGIFTNVWHIRTNNLCDKFVCVKIAVQHGYMQCLRRYYAVELTLYNSIKNGSHN